MFQEEKLLQNDVIFKVLFVMLYDFVVSNSRKDVNLSVDIHIGASPVSMEAKHVLVLMHQSFNPPGSILIGVSVVSSTSVKNRNLRKRFLGIDQ